MRELGTRHDHRAHQERQQRQFRPLRVRRVELGAQRLELGDVHLFDVAEMWDVLLGLLHLQRDAPAQPDHRYVLGGVGCGREGGGGSGRSPCLRGGGRSGSGRRRCRR